MTRNTIHWFLFPTTAYSTARIISADGGTVHLHNDKNSSNLYLSMAILSLEYVLGYMFMDNLYFHTIDVHVLDYINGSMALHTFDSSAEKKIRWQAV
jgi:hypothetical protein